MPVPGETLLGQMWITLAEKGMGKLLKPWQDLRENRASNAGRRHEILMLAQAKVDAEEVLAGRKLYRPDGLLINTEFENAEHGNYVQLEDGRVEPTITLLPELSASRIQAEAIRQEINQTKAIIFAEEQLANDTQDPPAEKIDEDWLHSWRDHAGKTSNEDIQKLWGSVLAGEVKSPGSYSLRTLEFLKGLSKQEAELIEGIVPFVINSSYVWRKFETLAQEGISYQQLLQLQEIGLLAGADSAYPNLRFTSLKPNEYFHSFVSHGKVVVATHPEVFCNIEIEMIKLTAIGQQVIRLASHPCNMSYFNAFGRNISEMGYDVEMGDCIARPNGIELMNMSPLRY
ncbi:DUF2806 domain-containing protein [Pseudomonas sp. PGPR40]|uniref:DUF2806 domain-containing protein n=1 Tax=Pseudomonas sp. PGPR40 TaxID=2913476 RepID=UPI001EDB9890|nr:DUF2806 domain-containing protein [Pseudomonas sp. PGPR40]